MVSCNWEDGYPRMSHTVHVHSGPIRERPIRSLLKAISWRVIGSIDTFVIVTFITGDPGKGGIVAIIEIATKPVLYFLHERAWALTKFGQQLRVSVRYRKHHPFGRKASENAKRSIAKAVTWRFLASLDTTILTWIVHGHFVDALGAGLVEVGTKFVLYYIHERIWARLRIGLERKPVAQHPVAVRLG